MNSSIYTLLSYKESPKVEIIFKIISGDFENLECKLDDFLYTINYNIGYNYHILNGEVPINKGDEFKLLTMNILKDIILKIHNKEVVIEST